MTGEAREDQGPERLQQRLAASEARYRALVESSPVGIVVHAGGVVRFANARALEIVRATSPDQVVGREVLDFVHPDERARVTARVRGAYDAGEGAPLIEERWIAADGTTIAVEVMSTPTTWDGARASQVVFSDVSKRRPAEEDLGRLEKQLLRAQKMEAIGRLASGVAHDFNNILGGILSNVHYLQTRGPGLEAEPLEEVLSDIRTGVDRGARLCGNLLAFSRHLPSEVARVSVAEVVDTTVRLHRRTFDRSIRIETRVPAELHVQASRAEIEQVLMNLCLNARDAMPAGGELTISARAIDEGRTVELEVRDTGHGMDATTRERAFEPFYTTSRPGEGSGLGLSVAYGIVRAHGGTLELDSAPDAGCRMRILLPSAPAAQGQAPAEASAPGDRPDGRGLHVLLIDDEPLALRATSRFLKSVGFRVTAVPCGDDALARVRDREAAIDLVVLDMVMPGMDGEQTLRAMRGAGLTAPVLLVSGFDGGRRVERCLEDGAEGFLAKPVDPSTLVRELERLAGRPARADSA